MGDDLSTEDKIKCRWKWYNIKHCNQDDNNNNQYHNGIGKTVNWMVDKSARKKHANNSGERTQSI